ncbi:MAG: nucleotidyltransferase domain-containing protein [Candidatus Helarchaeota archaeon]
MPKLCQIDLNAREEIYLKIQDFANFLKKKLEISKIYLFGSFAKGNIHEGSDIDLIIIGNFKERFVERIGMILELTDLPIEPLVYTEEEFKEMLEGNNFFLKNILSHAKEL